ncbi:unnamed protein product [Cyberlindnera jadinii]|uniref:RBR-type E3 ubiquitin transferase n=1 Tax=Cyberlindnera jadinii (strain ATCC 18201 / CBS 1600 / BCRC 20928 / JCM 3617 / NBRC 0987 / NRRL Y-1542) TaxID=983966 RepID=A0A0H5C3C6_CYBJN|nr:hypothetical protein CYBJADRAFT_165969 [Cyberlindnera jadinii NRRL Y-1542]ODV75214.1 hypothetical protein CYBJADRAFT_165969 [Cyberlindnera jadinii NRRL Y-1542]CEP22373.1 unnamed protein product [Cyberlindnera jadinii]
MSDEEFEYTDDSDSLYSDSVDDDNFKIEDSLVKHDIVQYKQHTTREMMETLHKKCTKLSEVLGKPHDYVVTLLQSYKWNSEKLIEDYMDDPQDVELRLGLSTVKLNGEHHENTGLQTYTEEAPFSCFICCEDKLESYKLKCGHEFCLDCYRTYLNEKVKQANVIKCPSCDVALTPGDIDTISGTNGSSVLLENSIKEYVERHKTYKWCPSPDCNAIVEVLNSSDIAHLVDTNQIPIVICSNGHRFCFNCGFESHVPAPCNVTKQWINKCKDDSETVKWITTHTKTCPKCDTSIEKNGGCNHMTCRKCAYEFCWICLGTWDNHNNQYYQCNRYQYEQAEKNNKSAKDKKLQDEATKKSLQRYLHYYNLFNIHEISTKQDKSRCDVVENTVREVQEGVGISWIEAQFLVDSASTLLNARRVLKWSYAVAFYCDRGYSLDLFETVQAGLADAVEALSLLFEISDVEVIAKKKLNFLNASKLLEDRQRAMVLATEETINNGTLRL